MRQHDGLATGESRVAAAIACLVHPCSKQALAARAAHHPAKPSPGGVCKRAHFLTSIRFWRQP
jgi:hypothetical protein